MMRQAIVLVVILFSVTAYAQTQQRRLTNHRLPDREPTSEGLQMYQFGKAHKGTPLHVKETPKFNEYRYNLARFVTTDGKKPIKVEITQPANTPIYLDQVYMEFEGKKIKPVKAMADGVDITSKLAKRDDECACFQNLILEFPATGKSDISEATIVFAASAGERVDAKSPNREDDGPKVYQTNKYYNYESGSHRGIIEYDGTICPKDELGKPSFKESVQTVQGGVKQPLRIWVRDDGSNLYVVLEVVGDTSVNDKDDKTILYVRGDGPLKSFVAGAGGGSYGSMGTAFTASSDVEHRVYEFKIPFAELPSLDANGKWGISFAVTM